ncbi:G-protein coupled receptor GRL101 [Biomphalaria glabrata]
MLLLTTFLYVGLSLSFPLKDCQSRNQDILFIIDCRSEVQEQIDFIQTTTNYLSKRYDLKQNHSVMMFTAHGITEINNFTDIQDMQLSCSQSFPINDIFNASEVWFKSRDRPLVTLVFFSHSSTAQYTDVKTIIKRQKKDKQVDRFFFLPDKDEFSEIFDNIFFYLYKSYRKLNIVDIFAKICELSCKKSIHTFTTQGSMKSYYHIANVYNKSHDESVKYCEEQQMNSYLISLESPQEINFLFNLLEKKNITKNLKSLFRPLNVFQIFQLQKTIPKCIPVTTE